MTMKLLSLALALYQGRGQVIDVPGQTYTAEVAWPYPLTWTSSQALANLCITGLNVDPDMLTDEVYCPLVKEYASNISQTFGIQVNQITDVCGTPGIVTMYHGSYQNPDTCRCQVKVTCASSLGKCPSGTMAKPNFDQIQGSNVGMCCDEVCTPAVCPQSYKFKVEGASLLGSSKEVCCDKTCSNYPCPTDFALKSNAQNILGNDTFSCCDSTCAVYPCGPYTQPVSNAAGTVGFDQDTCCQKLCGGFHCSAGSQPKPNVANVVGYSADVCCEPVPTTTPPPPQPTLALQTPAPLPTIAPPKAPVPCGCVTCNASYVKKPNVDSLFVADPLQCCDKTCALLDCPAPNYQPKLSARDLVSSDRNVCCEKLCPAIHAPPYGVFRPKPNFKTTVVTNGCDCGCDCYDQYCGPDFSCPKYMGLKANPSSIMGYNASVCCDKMCSGFVCPVGLLPVASMVHDVKGNSVAECCVAPATTTTGAPTTQPPVTFLTTRATTTTQPPPPATPTCLSVFCPIGFQQKPNPSTIRGQSLKAEDCCDQMCSSLVCPAPMYRLKEDGLGRLGYTQDECCDLLCPSFDCPDGYQNIQGYSYTVGNDLRACCVPIPKPPQSCGGFQCQAPSKPKPNPNLIYPKSLSQEACCDQTCTNYDCGAGFKLKSDAQYLVGASKDLCCDKTCGNFECPAGTQRVPNAADIAGEDVCKCCKELCSTYTCAPYTRHIDAATTTTGGTQEECCTKLCSGFPCPANMMPVADASEKVGFSADECCQTYATTTPVCTACHPDCRNYPCEAGWTLIADPQSVVGSFGHVDHDQCCLRTCTLLICPNDMKYKSGYTTISGDISVGMCCDPLPTTLAPTLPPTTLPPTTTPLTTVATTIVPTTTTQPPPTTEPVKPTCGAFVCPNGYLSNARADQIGWSVSDCCAQACSNFVCSPGYALKSNAASLLGFSTSSCCDKLPTCASYTCPAGTSPKANAVTLLPTGSTDQQTATCCDKTCAAEPSPCGAGYQLKPTASMIQSTDRDVCCDQLCYPELCKALPHMAPKKDYKTLIGNTMDVCCKKICHCPPNTLATYPHGHSECPDCLKLCRGYSCPTYQTLKFPMMDKPGDDPATCCQQMCSGVSCPAGTLPIVGADRVPGSTPEVCCTTVKQQGCMGFQCSSYGDFQLKVNAGILKGVPSVDLCCDPLCSSVQCPVANYKPRPNAKELIGSTPDECCEKDCNIFPCPAGYKQKDGFLSELGSGNCCEQLCLTVACPLYTREVNDYVTKYGSDVATCCVNLCSGVTCPGGTLPKPGADGLPAVPGQEQETCCDKVCTSFACPQNWKPKSNAAFIAGGSKEVCCDQELLTCISGLVPAASSNLVSALSQKIESTDLDSKLLASTKSYLSSTPYAIVETMKILPTEKQVCPSPNTFTDFTVYYDEPAGFSVLPVIGGCGLALVVIGAVAAGVASWRLKRKGPLAGALAVSFNECEAYRYAGQAYEEASSLYSSSEESE